MSNNKRAFKLSEFIAHGSNVNCVSIGRKTTRIAATGGEDKKVNLWTLNKPTCIMSLTGHTSAVHSVTFSTNEDKISSGSQSGSLKIWDLEVNRLICNLVGHKSTVVCSEFHAYADYLASGSVDSHIRLWDLRRKGCIFTYKGHTGAVNSLRFSPDSKWIASASDDSTVKIWDLKAGRLLTELKGHTSAINTLEFHPNEFLLATGSSDRTARFWDLEKMELVNTSTLTPSSIKVIQFDPEGQCLFAGSQDYLHTYSWEPAKCHDAVFCQWKQIHDLIFTSNSKLVGASLSQNMVSFHAVDLAQVAPLGTPPVGVNNPASIQPVISQTPATLSKPLSGSTRRNFNHQQRLEQPSEQLNDIENSIQKQENEHLTDDGSMGNICNVDEYNRIFRPKNEIKRAQQQGGGGGGLIANPVVSKNTPTHVSVAALRQQQQQQQAAEYSSSPQSQSVAAFSRPLPQQQPSVQIFAPQQPPSPSHKLNSPFHEKHALPTNVVQSLPSKEILNQKLSEDKKLNDNNQYGGVNMNDFMPKAEHEEKLDALDLVSNIESGHDPLMKAIRIRLRNIQNIRSIWTNGNIKLALDTAVSMDDMTVMADILNQLNQTVSIWTLDICTILLPPIKKLIDSKYEEHVQVGCDSAKIILKNFGKLIKANIITPGGVGVDISREERQRKCTHCFDYLTAIILIIDKKSQLPVSQKLITCFREINLLMKTLD